MKKNKILIPLLTAWLVLPLLTSCQNGIQQDMTTATTASTPITTPSVTETAPTATETTTSTPTETTIPPHDHVYHDEVTEPTCTEAGYTTHICYICGESYTDTETPARGHHHLPTVIRPTGTEQGYTEHTCTECGDSYRDSYTDPITQEVIINFDRQGGTMEGYDIRIYRTGTHVDLPIPTKEGFVFEGWYYEDTLIESGPWSITDGVWLTAHWAPITADVSFKLGEGGESLGYAYVSAVWGSALGNLPTPTPEFGYLFAGWYDGDTLVTAETVSYYTETVTLTARFTAPLENGTMAPADGTPFLWAIDAAGTLSFRPADSSLDSPRFTIPEDAFADNANIRTVAFSDQMTLTDIGQRAFARCLNLQTITVPGSIGVLRSSVFEGCTALTEIMIGSGISVINEDAFKDCSALTTLTLPQSLFQIYSPLSGCTALSAIRYQGTEFQWSVIVKDPNALAALTAEGVAYTFEHTYPQT